MEVKLYMFEKRIVKGKVKHDIVTTYLGTVTVEKFDPEHIWKLCNWSNWAEEKPENLHADISSCDHGLCIVDPETNKNYLALSHSWLVGNVMDIFDYVVKNRNKLVWV